ncbi:unnamed protein product [Calypogeia fissa]
MSKRKKYLTCSRKYDLPLFCAAWTGSIAESKPAANSESEAGPSTGRTDDNADDKGQLAGAGVGHVVFGGGGGDRKNGVKNLLVLAHYDFGTDVLSEAISTSSTDDDPPYRLAVHPGSNEIVCSVSKDCRLFELRSDDGVKLESSEKLRKPLRDVGEQNCLVFSADGTRFATGGEDGHLRVFEWPSLELLLNEPNAHQSVKDLDFSLDSSLLASTGDSGPCRIWDISKASAVAVLTSDKGSNLGFCRFSRDGTKSILYITLREGGKGLIGMWDTNSWEKVGAKKLSDVPISAFSISPDGKFLAIGSSEGALSIVDAKRLAATQQLKSAHMVFVTSMEFSPNSRALLSVSGDSSARVTAVTESSKLGGLPNSVLILLIVVLLSLLYILASRGR